MKTTTLCILTIALALTGCAAKETTDAKTTVEKKATGKTEKVAKKVEAEKEAPQKATEKVTENAADTAAFGNVTCKSGSDERTVASHKTETGGCEVKYTKNGETNSVANAQADESYCTGVVGKIKGNLEAAGFNCSGT